MNKTNLRRILSFIALGIIIVLAGTIIALTIIDRDYNVNLQSPFAIEVKVNNASNSQSYYNSSENQQNQEVYNTLLKKYNQSFKQKIMSGIFQGIWSNNASIEKVSSNINSTLSSGTYLHFVYNEQQTLMLNGKPYVYHYSNSSSTITDIKYKDVYVEVKNSTAVTDINIYIVQDYNNNSQATYFSYKYVVKACQSDLYQYIQSNLIDA